MTEEAQQGIRQKISKNLRKRIKASRTDVAALAKASEVSPAMIYKILNCSSAASADTLEALAAALDIPVLVLVS